MHAAAIRVRPRHPVFQTQSRWMPMEMMRMSGAAKRVKTLKIKENRNPVKIGDYTKHEWNLFDPGRLAALREQYALDEVTRSGRTEWEQLLLLRNWLQTKLRYGWTGYAELRDSSDPLDILHLAERGKSFACGIYAALFVQCCAALGYRSRKVSILKEHADLPGPQDAAMSGHCVAEVWSNDFAKWIMFDTTMNWHYEMNGVPLSAYEASMAWYGGQLHLVDQVPRKDTLHLDREELRAHVQGFYQAVKQLHGEPFADRHYSTEAAILDVWKRYMDNKNLHFYANIVIFEGNRPYMPADQACMPLLLVNGYPIQRAWPGLEWVSNPADVYYSLNQTFVKVNVTDPPDEGERKIELHLSHTMPDFKHYELRINGREWAACEASCILPLAEGNTTLEARAVNGLNRIGMESGVVVSVAYDE